MNRTLINLFSFARHLWHVLKACMDRRTPLHLRVLGVLALFYAISPLDLVPDVIPGVGILDDLLIVPFVLNWIWKRVPVTVQQDIEPVAIDPRDSAASETARQQKRPFIAFLLLIAVWLLWLWSGL